MFPLRSHTAGVNNGANSPLYPWELQGKTEKSNAGATSDENRDRIASKLSEGGGVRFLIIEIAIGGRRSSIFKIYRDRRSRIEIATIDGLHPRSINSCICQNKTKQKNAQKRRLVAFFVVARIENNRSCKIHLPLLGDNPNIIEVEVFSVTIFFQHLERHQLLLGKTEEKKRGRHELEQDNRIQGNFVFFRGNFFINSPQNNWGILHGHPEKNKRFYEYRAILVAYCH